MKLKTLVKELPDLLVKGSKEIEITGISANSKTLFPGNIFVAKRGQSFDGNAFIPEAIQAGASAILTDMYDPSNKEIAQLIHHDVALMEALLAHSYFEKPSDSLLMIGVTGTSGKTTTSYLIRQALERLHKKTALIGTIEYLIGQIKYEGVRTTPDLTTNIKLLREALNQQCDACVMEVTSHAMAQGRVQGIDYDIGVFLNLTHEHLDYHKTMEHYFESKKLLFETMQKMASSSKKGKKRIVLNADSPWTEKIQTACTLPSITFGIDTPCDLTASEIRISKDGTEALLNYRGQQIPFFSPLIGRFNVQNCLAAIATLLSLDIPLSTVVPLFTHCTAAPGRLEKVLNTAQKTIFVDFAHKVDAMQCVLTTMREVTPIHGKLICVFGCGGDRDKEKRPMMGRIAEQLADTVVITSDNPRSEDPQTIINEILSGCTTKEKHLIEIDRQTAIEKAIQIASKNDIVLILGKGHETKQIFNGKVIDFDDRIIARNFCDRLYE